MGIIFNQQIWVFLYLFYDFYHYLSIFPLFSITYISRGLNQFFSYNYLTEKKFFNQQIWVIFVPFLISINIYLYFPFILEHTSHTAWIHQGLRFSRPISRGNNKLYLLTRSTPIISQGLDIPRLEIKLFSENPLQTNKFSTSSDTFVSSLQNEKNSSLYLNWIYQVHKLSGPIPKR